MDCIFCVCIAFEWRRMNSSVWKHIRIEERTFGRWYNYAHNAHIIKWWYFYDYKFCFSESFFRSFVVSQQTLEHYFYCCCSRTNWSRLTSFNFRTWLLLQFSRRSIHLQQLTDVLLLFLNFIQIKTPMMVSYMIKSHPCDIFLGVKVSHMH